MLALMIPLFLGLTALNLLCLAAATLLGAWVGGSARGGYHILAGAMASLVCCAVHCVVFTYFAATGKWVQHAVQVKSLDASLVQLTRSFRAQAFPAAMIAMAAVLLAAFSGAAADNYHGRAKQWHLGLSIAALGINAAAAVVEFRAISRNGRLIDEILSQINPCDAA
jgi:hypothetical protein